MGQLTRGKFTCCMILLGGYCLGMVIIRRSLSLLEIVLVVVFTEGNYSRGDCQVVSSFPEGNFYNENCLGVIVQEQLSLVGTWFSFPRVNCLGDNCPGGKYLV